MHVRTCWRTAPERATSSSSSVFPLPSSLFRERTKAGLQVAKRRGAKIGSPRAELDLGRAIPAGAGLPTFRCLGESGNLGSIQLLATAAPSPRRTAPIERLRLRQPSLRGQVTATTEMDLPYRGVYGFPRMLSRLG